MKTISRFALGAVAVSTAVATWGIAVERHLPVLRDETIPVLPRGAAPLRVLHISDTHLAPWQTKKIEWLRSLANTKPDLVVLTGDLLGHKEALPALREALLPFAGTPGVFVHGSNDYYGPILKNPLKYLQEPSRLSTKETDIDTQALEDFLTGELGFINLNNSATDIELRGSNVRFFGLGDPHIRYDDEEAMKSGLASLDSASASGLRIGVVHAPYRQSLDTLLAASSDVIFAGHTHGGQVRVPFFGALTSNSDLPPSQARGLSVWHKDDSAAFLHVSAGLGTSIFAPVRFACRPEATILLFTAR